MTGRALPPAALTCFGVRRYDTSSRKPFLVSTACGDPSLQRVPEPASQSLSSGFQGAKPLLPEVPCPHRALLPSSASALAPVRLPSTSRINHPLLWARLGLWVCSVAPSFRICLLRAGHHADGIEEGMSPRPPSQGGAAIIPGAQLPGSLPFNLVVVNFMCPLAWAKGRPDSWSHITSGCVCVEGSRREEHWNRWTE